MANSCCFRLFSFLAVIPEYHPTCILTSQVTLNYSLKCCSFGRTRVVNQLFRFFTRNTQYILKVYLAKCQMLNMVGATKWFPLTHP